MRKTLILAAIAAAFIPMASHAADGGFIDARLSTLGGGLEIGGKLTSHVTGRLVANGFDYNYNTTNDGIDYRGKLKLGSVGAQADYVFGDNGPFYVTAGVYANSNKLHATATPAAATQIGLITYSPAQIGTITSDAKFKGSAPYLGLGWRWSAGSLLFNLEAGAYFQGKPTVTMTSNGTLANDPAYQTQLETERQSLQDDLKGLATYPVVAAGIGYKF